MTLAPRWQIRFPRPSGSAFGHYYLAEADMSSATAT